MGRRCSQKKKVVVLDRDIKASNEQSKQESWFKGVFSEANQYPDDEENENEDVDEGDNIFEF